MHKSRFRIARVSEITIDIGGIPRNTRVEVYLTPEPSTTPPLVDSVTLRMSHEDAKHYHVGETIEVGIAPPAQAAAA